MNSAPTLTIKRATIMYEEWKPIFTALACDIMDKMGYREQAMDDGVRPAHDSQQVAGRALTLDAHATTEVSEDPYAQLFKAYDHMQTGDVVVIATNGERRSGLWGGLLSTAARARGVEAVVTDGLVRDVREMNEMGFACFSRGYSPLDSDGRCLPTALNVAIECGGVRIDAGDLILADVEGVVAIPQSIREEVLRRCLEKLEGESTVRRDLEAGDSPRVVFDRYGIL